MALRRAVKVVSERGFDRVVFDSDCLSLDTKVLSPKPDRSWGIFQAVSSTRSTRR